MRTIIFSTHISAHSTISVSNLDVITLGSRSDIVVNAANPFLGGIGPDLPEGVGGVDGAIHRAAGIDLYRACLALPVVRLDEELGGWIRCNPGDLVVTEGFGVSRSKIYHAVGPYFKGGRSMEWSILQTLYRRVFDCFAASNLKTIVIPPIGTGSYRVPKRPAAYIAVAQAISSLTHGPGDVTFSVINEGERSLYLSVLEEMLPDNRTY